MAHPNVAATSQDEGDGATKLPVVEMQTKPKKPPDNGCLDGNKIVAALLKTGFMLILMMLIVTSPLFMMKMKMGSVIMCPMMMMSGTALLETYGKVTYTKVVTVKTSVVMDMWDNMELFQFENTIGLARRMLLYKSVHLLDHVIFLTH